MFNPKVSVIVPVYNLEDYIRDTVDSLLAQTYQNIEIVLIDDGSSDNSLSIIKELAEIDDRIVYTTQSNGGAARARNAGLDLATGEYITFVDGDDRLSSNTIAENIKFFTDKCLDWVAFSVRKVDTVGESLTGVDKGFIVHSAEYLEAEDFVPYFYEHKLSGVACGAIYKRESIKKIRFVENLFYEDSMFFVDLMCNTKKGYLSTIGMYYYIDRPDSSNKSYIDSRHLESKYYIVCERLSQYRKLYKHYEYYYALDENLNYYFFKREAAKGTEGAELFYDNFKKRMQSKKKINLAEEVKCLIHKFLRK